MAVQGRDHRHLRPARKQLGHLPLEAQRVEPVAVDPGHRHPAAHPSEGGGQAAPAPADVVVVHRLREDDVAAGVEPPGQLVGVVIEVRLHGIPATAAGRRLWCLGNRERVLSRLRRPAEPRRQFRFAPVAQVADPPGDAHPPVRPFAGAGVVVVAAPEGRIGPDRLVLHGAQGDLLGAGRRPAGHHHRPLEPIGVSHRPFQGPHPAHRPSDGGRPPLDPEGVGQRRLHRHLITDGDRREAAAVRLPVRRVGGRAGRALAPAEDVGADDEPPVGVDVAARADGVVPPSGVAVPGPGRPGGVAVAGERVSYQDCVGPGPIELSPRLVGHDDRRQAAAELQLERNARRREQGDELSPPRRVAGPPGPRGRRSAGRGRRHLVSLHP